MRSGYMRCLPKLLLLLLLLGPHQPLPARACVHACRWLPVEAASQVCVTFGVKPLEACQPRGRRCCQASWNKFKFFPGPGRGRACL